MNSTFVRLIGALSALVLVTGCATTASNRYDVVWSSQPEGAMIIEQGTGRQLGIAPVRAQYYLSNAKVRCMPTQGVTAKWVSGVTVSTLNPYPICGPLRTYSFVLSRPLNASGFEKDMQFALQVQQTRAMQTQSDVALGLILMGTFNNTLTYRPNINCRSYTVGTTLMTKCY